MPTFFAALLISAIANLLLVRFSYLHVKFSGDELTGPQKLHRQVVPRIGGLGIIIGIAAGGVVLFLQPKGLSPESIFIFLGVTFPSFVFGFSEDLTKHIPPRARLWATMASGALGYLFLGAAIRYVGVPGVDTLLSFWPLAFILTIFAVAGLANAINIIDGLNGLSAGVALMILLAFAYVALKVGDLLVLHLCLAASGAVLGFLIWNFPAGLIFLGDGGAYLVGTVLAEIALLLVVRNPRVSPWFPMLVVIYPVFETLYSAYRRTFVHRRSPASADALHLHSLVYRRLLGWMLSSRPGARWVIQRNAMTTVYLWGLEGLCIIPGLLLFKHTYWLMGFVVAFMATYVWLYTCIVKFHSPVWLRRLFALSRLRSMYPEEPRSP